MAVENFEHHLWNIPHIENETDTARYLRAFDQMLATGPELDPDVSIAEAARDALRFVADDAFRRGFEACHDNLLVPLRQSSITTEDAEKALQAYGERVRNGIAALFEDGPGVPTQTSVEIDEMPLPPLKGLLQ
ncbi:hypothetical protein MUO32_05240 [Shinella sp. CPCC 101442]|uniref:hypothetical protein n=1 Tax=Shinella sp. CPCC 101442 TaxID=2932265 RepID=UPI0021528DDC|nr:hypothetical protein [Shinella sp. CPCC 101442]MCR6498430.1 hypothetical protein [Shinella sp. CPCC 101442]